MTQEQREQSSGSLAPAAAQGDVSAGTSHAAVRPADARLPNLPLDTSFADVPQAGRYPPGTPPLRLPVAGALCIIFGVVAFYHTTLLLAPLALIAGIVALCRRQYGWAAIGMIAAVVALLTDVAFWTLLGAAWIVRWLAWS